MSVWRDCVLSAVLNVMCATGRDPGPLPYHPSTTVCDRYDEQGYMTMLRIPHDDSGLLSTFLDPSQLTRIRQDPSASLGSCTDIGQEDLTGRDRFVITCQVSSRTCFSMSGRL